MKYVGSVRGKTILSDEMGQSKRSYLIDGDGAAVAEAASAAWHGAAVPVLLRGWAHICVGGELNLASG